MPQSAETFFYYVNCPEFISEEFLTQWPSSLSNVKNDKRCCPQCERDVENLNYTIEPAVVLLIEFSTEVMNFIVHHESLILNVVTYKLSGVVRNSGAHFTVSKHMNDFYIDDLQQQTRIFTSFSEVKELFSDGWFFCCFLNSEQNMEDTYSIFNININNDVVDFAISSSNYSSKNKCCSC